VACGILSKFKELQYLGKGVQKAMQAYPVTYEPPAKAVKKLKPRKRRAKAQKRKVQKIHRAKRKIAKHRRVLAQ
jgi:hypothetical protein